MEYGLEKVKRYKKVIKKRIFNNAECINCSLKGSSYCWRNCPYNSWREKQIE